LTIVNVGTSEANAARKSLAKSKIDKMVTESASVTSKAVVFTQDTSISLVTAKTGNASVTSKHSLGICSKKREKEGNFDEEEEDDDDDDYDIENTQPPNKYTRLNHRSQATGRRAKFSWISNE
jgi:hypothetical protein